jgi:protease I
MKALFLAADGIEDLEFFYPYYRFQELGFDVDVAGVRPGTVQGKHGYSIPINLSFEDVNPEEYDILFLAGGKAPESIRLHEKALEITCKFFDEDKVVAAICHGPQILVSAGRAAGRNVTCYKGIKDDLIAAGAVYEDKAVVVDDQLITSRMPDDLPAMCREIFETLRIII